jgi:hypothetical protein
MTTQDQVAEAAQAEGLSVRDYLEAHLDDPADPYFSAHLPDWLIRYFAPMACGEIERFESCRRYRTTGRDPREPDF